MILVEILLLTQSCDPKVEIQGSDLLCFHWKHLCIHGIPSVFVPLEEGLPLISACIEITMVDFALIQILWFMSPVIVAIGIERSISGRGYCVWFKCSCSSVSSAKVVSWPMLSQLHQIQSVSCHDLESLRSPFKLSCFPIYIRILLP